MMECFGQNRVTPPRKITLFVHRFVSKSKYGDLLFNRLYLLKSL